MTPAEAALSYAACGWRVFPVYELQQDGTCACTRDCGIKSAGKHPRVQDQHRSASDNAEDVTEWWTAWPDANVGISCGVSGLVVLDLESIEGHGTDGLASLEALAAGREVPDTFVVKTGSGGLHLYFKRPDGARIPSRNHIAPGIDVRCENGYVLAPPSNHRQGHYELLDDRNPAPLPEWLLPLLEKKEAPKPAPAPRKTATPAERKHALAILEKCCAEIGQRGKGRDHFAAKVTTCGGLVWALGRELVEKALAETLERRGSSAPPQELERWVNDFLDHGEAQPLDLATLDGVKFGAKFKRARELSTLGPANDNLTEDDEPEDSAGTNGLKSRTLHYCRTLGGGAPPVPTGLKTLDANGRGGLRLRTTTILGGAPSAGKTTLAVQLAWHYARAGLPVAIIAADEDPQGLLMRVGQASGISREALEEGLPFARDKLVQAVAGAPIEVYDGEEEGVTVEAVAEALAARCGGSAGGGVLIVDSLQTAKTETSTEAQSKREEIDDVVKTCKQAAKMFGLIVIATSELARAAYRSKKASENVDDMAAAKETGGIEYAATNLLVLRTPPGEGSLVDVTVPKMRGGKREAFRLELDHARATFAEVDRPKESEAPPKEHEAMRNLRIKEMIWRAIRANPDKFVSARSIKLHIRGSGQGVQNGDVEDFLRELIGEQKVQKQGTYYNATQEPPGE